MQPNHFTLFYSGMFLLAIGLGWLRFRRSAALGLPDRLVNGVIPASLVGVGFLLLSKVLYVPFWDWSAKRLLYSFILASPHHHLYNCPENFSPFLHGPVGALAYMPATLCRTPTNALLFGGVLSILFYFVPVVILLFWGRSRNPKTKLFALAGLLVFCLSTFESPPLAYSAFGVHVDAPALLLMGVACVALYHRQEENESLRLFVSAVAVALAVFTKITCVLLPLALFVYLWMASGKQCALRFLGYLAFAFLLVSVLFCCFFDSRALLYCVITLASEQARSLPWIGNDRPAVLFAVTQELVRVSLLPTTVLLFHGVCRPQPKVSGSRPRFSQWASNNPWLIFIVAAVAMAPLAIRHRVVQGGDVNSFMELAYFLYVAATVVLVEAAHNVEERVTALVSGAAKLLLFAALVGLMLIRLPWPGSLYAQWRFVNKNAEQFAYEVVSRNSQSHFFPEVTLGSFMGGGRLLPDASFVVDRLGMGRPYSAEEFRAAIPSSVRFVVFKPSSHLVGYIMPYLPEFSQMTVESSGWIVYRRP